MSQTEWQRRILLVTGREEEVESSKKDDIPELSSEATIDIYRQLFGLSNEGLISKNYVLKMIYGKSAKEITKKEELIMTMLPRW